MARRNQNENVEDTTAPEVENTEAVEAAVEAEAEGSENAETVEEVAEQPAAEQEADLTAFTTAVGVAVGQRDTNTGDLPEGALEPVLAAYRELPTTKDRNRAKAALKASMAEAMQAGDLPLARGYFTLQENMTTAATKSAAERKPADPTAQWKSNLLTAMLAYGELVANKPEGFEEDPATWVAAEAGKVTEQVNTYRAFLDAPEPGEGEEAPEKPDVPSEVVAAFRLVRGGKVRASRSTGGGGGTGERRDLGKHIQEAFANLEEGAFLSVAEIKKAKSSVYEDEQPSAGAISARLFPKTGECTVPGIEPGIGGDKNTKGAFKKSA